LPVVSNAEEEANTRQFAWWNLSEK